MPEVVSNVPNPATGLGVREVTTAASAGVQQVISQADGSTGALAQVNTDGSASVRPTGATAGIVTRLTAATTSATALGAGTRRGFTVQVDASASTLYLLLGTGTASATNCSAILGSGDYYEAPYNYAGPVQHVWSGAVGGANLTELT